MLLIIDNYDSFTYNLYQLVASLVGEVRVVRNDKLSVAEVKQLKPQAIILSPGPGRPEDAGICVKLVQKLSGQAPILGVCLGHQAIAQAFGGIIIQSETVVHGKKTSIFHQRSGIYATTPLPFVAGRYHSLIVERKSLPVVFRIEAENEEGIIMGIKHCQHPTYGVQFHPESILTPMGEDVIKAFINLCKEETA